MLIGIDGNEANITSRVGVNKYAFNLLHALKKSNSNHQFVIYLKNPPLPDMPESAAGWDYRIIPFPKLWTQTRLPWDLYTHRPRPDVFFTPSHYAPRWSPVPIVISIMDLGFLDTPQQFTSRDFNQLKSWTKYSVHKAKKIIAISQYTKNHIVSVYKRNPEDVIVTHLGYDKSLYKPNQNPQILEKYHITKPYFLFLSSLKPSKNVEGLIRGFARLTNTDIQLVIAGKKAWLYDQIFQMVNDLKLTDRVIFPGFVNESDVPALMSQSLAFVLPSFHEGFGIPVLEAMACGTPVVISKVASLPEVAGLAAIYVDPTNIDSITQGLNSVSDSNRSKYISKGLLQAKKFEWETTARQTLKVLESAKSVK